MKFPLLIALMLSCAPLMACSATGPKPAVSAISHEPLYVGIVRQAHHLKTETDQFVARPSLTLLSDPKFIAYTHGLTGLSNLNLKAHLDLKARGTDNDLKCVLKGVSLDLKIKRDHILTAKSADDIRLALTELSDLLRDNIDVITTPATAESGLDCLIEFG